MTSYSPAATLRLRLAGGIAEEIFKDTAPAAVVVTGSTATGDATTGSDLDIVVFHADVQLPYEEERVVEGVYVGIEHYPSMLFEEMFERRDLTLAELRLLGRVHGGIAVRDIGGFFAMLQARAGMVRLAPSQLKGLLGSARRMRECAQQYSSSPAHAVVFWRSAAESLAMALLNTQPPWYRQPKWTIADLRRVAEGCAVHDFLSAQGLEAVSVADARHAAQAAAHLLDALMTADSSDTSVHRQARTGLMQRLHHKYLQNAMDLLATQGPSDAVYCARVAVDLRCAALCPPELWLVDKLTEVRRLFERLQRRGLLDSYETIHGLRHPNLQRIKESVNGLSRCLQSRIRVLYTEFAEAPK